MNSMLRKKIDEIIQAEKYSCWYLVKQKTSFTDNCYLVSFLMDYQALGCPGILEDYIKKRSREIKVEKGLNVTDVHRALRVASVYGLITMPTQRFEDAIATETFEEITNRCNGEYENMSLYQDIIDRQLEKIYIGSSLDGENETIRKDYRLFAVMLLYKVLLELGQSTDNYSVDMLEYKMIVATTKKYEDFLETLYLIKLLREDDDARAELKQYERKVDNRMIVAIKQLSTISVSSTKVELKKDYIEQVRKTVFLYEQNAGELNDEDYLKLLGSSKPLVDAREDSTNGGRIGENILLYGVPGAGKSWTIDQYYVPKDKPDFSERVVFHPDYTYSDFVGQLLPNNKNGKLEYIFTPGPFTRILKRASTSQNRNNHYWLIIEELNRGNAPAIFGDIFQLLDRKPDGTSKYEITNADIAEEVFGDDSKKVGLPNNLSIIATMNTSDQNVFTLDTAFQRRWQMKMIDNDFEENKHTELMTAEVLDTGISWKEFATRVNNAILKANENNMVSTADKQLGTHFINEQDLHISKTEVFAEKVLKYLWDDAVKMDTTAIFDPKYKELRIVIKDFKDTYQGKERLSKVLSPVFDELDTVDDQQVGEEGTV